MFLGFFSLPVGYFNVVTTHTCSSPEGGHHHEEGDGADDAHETDTGKGPNQTSKLPYQIQRF
jgi:hypothetical protein